MLFQNWFQSLSGFPLSCDGDRVAGGLPCILVSIPIGFSIELRHCRCRYLCRRSAGVSIPIGFSIELRRAGGDRDGQTIFLRFNPYRVFH